jgi:hypothetical protein
MRFMLIRKADADSEAGVLPSPAFMAAMQQYNDELAQAGVFLDGVGLRASSKGARVKINGGAPTVTDSLIEFSFEIAWPRWNSCRARTRHGPRSVRRRIRALG